MSNCQNLTFSLQEGKKNNEKNDEKISYEDIFDLVTGLEEEEQEEQEIGIVDEYTTLEIDYNMNFTRKELDRIADYYQIPKRKKNKQEIVVHIILFELNVENSYIVYKRKQLWGYIKEIQEDKYLSKFLILP